MSHMACTHVHVYRLTQHPDIVLVDLAVLDEQHVRGVPAWACVYARVMYDMRIRKRMVCKMGICAYGRQRMRGVLDLVRRLLTSQ